MSTVMLYVRQTMFMEKYSRNNLPEGVAADFCERRLMPNGENLSPKMAIVNYDNVFVSLSMQCSLALEVGISPQELLVRDDWKGVPKFRDSFPEDKYPGLLSSQNQADIKVLDDMVDEVKLRFAAGELTVELIRDICSRAAKIVKKYDFHFYNLPEGVAADFCERRLMSNGENLSPKMAINDFGNQFNGLYMLCLAAGEEGISSQEYLERAGWKVFKRFADKFPEDLFPGVLASQNQADIKALDDIVDKINLWFAAKELTEERIREFCGKVTAILSKYEFRS